MAPRDSRKSRLVVAAATTAAVCSLSSPSSSFVASGAARASAAPLQLQRGATVQAPLPAASSSMVAGCSALAAAGAVGAAVGRRTARRERRAVMRKAEESNCEVLLKQNASALEALKAAVPDLPAEYDDIKLLRFILQNEDAAEQVTNIKEVIAWRTGEGASVVKSAADAIAKAQAGGGWDNSAIQEAAPNFEKIGKYITSSEMLVVPTKSGDLVTCIQAAGINSEKMMKVVTEDEMIEFFIFAREVNTIVAEARTRATGRLVRLVAANDLTGVSSFPDKAFTNALTASAKKALTLYPGFSGPTVILNLPWVARLLVSFLTPLFPGAVRQKLKFAKGPMAYLEQLTDVLKEPTRSIFQDDFQAVLES